MPMMMVLIDDDGGDGDGDYDGENSTLYVDQTLPTNLPFSGTIITEDGSIFVFDEKQLLVCK